MLQVNINAVLTYFYLSGLITIAVIFWDFNFSKDKEYMEDLVADVTWKTGFDRKSVKALLYMLGMLGGFFLLPWEVISRFTKEE